MELLPIKNLIYEIRGYKVMLDFDLAEMYEVETKRLKEQVRRNIERFPNDFMFQLTKNEWNELVANCDQLPKNIKHSYILPSAFTQEGVAMLSGVLHSPIAIDANIRIMRAFVAVRQFVQNSPIDKTSELEREVKELKQYIEEVFTDYNDINEDTRVQLEQINTALAEMQVQNRLPAKPRRRIGFFTEEQRKNKEDMIE
ncbi:MAG: ORF6N domain-containing protein [Bacteroidetes bacterium]|nr:ORF6N domain-containing protein [Bacteroidota bacterium]